MSDGQKGDKQRSGQDRGKQRQQKKGGGDPRQGKRRRRGSRSPKANMVILIDSDKDYVEMESKAVVNYIAGYNPMGFTETGRALNYLQNPRNQGRIGLVLLDVDMEGSPEDKGVPALLELLGDSDVPLAIVTETNSPENVRRAIELEVNGIMPKPFTIDRFVRFAKELLRTGESTSWQCEDCGQVVRVERIDMLKMNPIKCTNRDCASGNIKKMTFPPETGSTDE